MWAAIKALAVGRNGGYFIILLLLKKECSSYFCIMPNESIHFLACKLSKLFFQGCPFFCSSHSWDRLSIVVDTLGECESAFSSQTSSDRVWARNVQKFFDSSKRLVGAIAAGRSGVGWDRDGLFAQSSALVSKSIQKHSYLVNKRASVTPRYNSGSPRSSSISLWRSAARKSAASGSIYWSESGYGIA